MLAANYHCKQLLFATTMSESSLFCHTLDAVVLKDPFSNYLNITAAALVPCAGPKKFPPYIHVQFSL